MWLLLRTFAGGCTALTGVEAVSNGVMAFREPTAKYARLTLAWIVGLLVAMLAGIAFLVRAYDITATLPGQAGYQSVLSLLVAAVAGKGIFYGVSMGAILIVLSLSANTAFAGFPRLARAIAQNGYLPHTLRTRGRRLVYAQGIYALAFLSGTLLVIFGGVTDRLIPLFAVGAFLAFTMSQAGMVAHWKRVRDPRSGRYMIINGAGAVATGLTVLVVLVAKFTEGAWITILLIPLLMLMMRLVKRHYDRVAREIFSATPLSMDGLIAPLVVILVDGWSRVTQKGLRFAIALGSEAVALHVDTGEQTEVLRHRWRDLVEAPAQQAGKPAPPLIVLDSPYRFVIQPILDYVLTLERDRPDRQICVLIPELVESRWYAGMLHDHRSTVLKALLLFKGDQRITVMNIPWYLSK
jgi:hypothetical protein